MALGKVTGAGGSGTLKKTLLWTNSSTTSCSAQKLTFENMQDFDFVEIEYKEKSSSTEIMSVIESTRHRFALYLNDSGHVSSSMAIRNISSPTETTIKINGAYSTRSSQTVVTNIFILTAIYGIKGKIK